VDIDAIGKVGAMALFALVLAQAVGLAEPPATPDQLVATFERFCLRTHADRENFDAVIASAPEARKVSSPSLFSGVEWNRRWKIGSVELSFLDAPPPSGRSCGVTAGAPGGFDGAAIVGEVTRLPNVTKLDFISGDPAAFARWSGVVSDGSTIIINNRPNQRGFGDIEIILRPASD
jgi:hypothetical protein